MKPRKPSRSACSAFTLIELLVVMAIIGVLIALLLPAVQAARSAARRVECVNNLMQFGIAMQTYENGVEVLPPGTVNPTGPIANKPVGYHASWIAQILPYIDEKNVYNHLNFQVGMYDVANATVRTVSIGTFLCPSDASTSFGTGVAVSNYAGNYHATEAPIDVKNNGLLFLNSAIRTEDIEDGASHTLLIGERVGSAIFGPDLGWASGTSSTLRNGGTPINTLAISTPKNLTPVGGFSSQHAGGANFCFADGSVHFVKNSLAPGVLQRLLNRADGDLLDATMY